MDILCNNINCDGIGMRRADWDNFRECERIMLNGQQIWGYPLSDAVKSQIYTEYAANPTLAAQIWRAANVYAKANPTTIPIINAHPKAYHACIDYVTEGLVFQMDCDWLCTAAQWQDRIGNIIFAGTNVQLQDGIPYFGGSASYINDSMQGHLATTHTIEIVYKHNNANPGSVMIYIEDISNCIAGSVYSNTNYITQVGPNGTIPMYSASAHNMLKTFSRSSRAYCNKTQVSAGSIDYWTLRNTNKVYIGRNAAGSVYDNGLKVYSIRIYNRLLTEQEILANQTADLFRWNS